MLISPLLSVAADNMLGAARILSRFDISVIGVNRGNLGFSDRPEPSFQTSLTDVLKGEFMEEERFLLETEDTSSRPNKKPQRGTQ